MKVSSGQDLTAVQRRGAALAELRWPIWLDLVCQRPQGPFFSAHIGHCGAWKACDQAGYNLEWQQPISAAVPVSQ